MAHRNPFKEEHQEGKGGGVWSNALLRVRTFWICVYNDVCRRVLCLHVFLGWELTAHCFYSLIEGRSSEQFPFFYSLEESLLHLPFLGSGSVSPWSKYSWLVGSALLSMVGIQHLTLLTQRLLGRNLLAVVWGFLLHAMSLLFGGGRGDFKILCHWFLSICLYCVSMKTLFQSAWHTYSVCCVCSSPP